MGVQISRLVESEEIEIKDLLGRRLAIDAFNTIFQFLTTIRQYDGTPLMDSNGRITSHLSGLFYRTAKFMEAGIKPIFVFDGEPPIFKNREINQRRERRAEAHKRMEEAKERGDFVEARKYAQQAASLTDEMIKESKMLLQAMGIPVVNAPSEGEAEAAFLVQQGQAWASASQDYDSLLFGAPRLITNLSISGKKKRGSSYVQIKPQLIDLKKTLNYLGIKRDQLILLGILVGTDYNPSGVEGIGPVKALQLVKKYPTLEKLVENIEWKFDVDIEKIFNFFKNPPVKEVEITFGKPDEGEIKKLLVDEHDFSEDRVNKVIERITGLKRESSLDRWIKS
ncbi:MAG: flap endonuclease-1 [Candidatus Aenigmarchaeota archaeon]|nr:flap endonuclease-1 [Candidatus Aenigmarchaeota archaeon]